VLSVLRDLGVFDLANAEGAEIAEVEIAEVLWQSGQYIEPGARLRRERKRLPCGTTIQFEKRGFGDRASHLIVQQTLLNPASWSRD
jgi:hypothetical protein